MDPSRSPNETITAQHPPTVSVVVPTFNRGDRIRRVCEPLLTDPATTELIVVVDGSTDDTVAVLDELGRRYDRLKVVEIRNSGVGAARQAGVTVASGEVVLFIDDDVIADPGLVSRHAARHADHGDLVVQGYMPTRVPNPQAPGDVFTRLYAREYERRARTWDDDSSLVLEHLWQGNVSIRREHLHHAPVSDPRFGYSYHEDQYFGWRLQARGLRGVFDRALTATHLHGVDVAGFRRVARRRGAGEWIARRPQRVAVDARRTHVRNAARCCCLAGTAAAGLVAEALAVLTGAAGRRNWWSVEQLLAKVLRRLEMWRGARLAGLHDGWLPEWGARR